MSLVTVCCLVIICLQGQLHGSTTTDIVHKLDAFAQELEALAKEAQQNEEIEAIKAVLIADTQQVSPSEPSYVSSQDVHDEFGETDLRGAEAFAAFKAKNESLSNLADTYQASAATSNPDLEHVETVSGSKHHKHTPYVCTKCGSKSSKYYVYALHKCTPRSKHATCSICQKAYISEVHLKTHQKKEHGISHGTIICKNCTTELSNAQNASQHSKQLTVCDKNKRINAILKNRKINPDRYSYTCPYCHKPGYAQFDHFRQHLRQSKTCWPRIEKDYTRLLQSNSALQ